MSWTAVIPFAGAIVEWAQRRGERKHELEMIRHQSKVKIEEKKAELQVAKLEAKEKRIRYHDEQDANWEAIHSQNSATSWKDEYVLIWMTAITTGLFLPWTQPYVEEGFAAMGRVLPDWWSWTLPILILASFGIRRLESYKALRP